MNNEGWAYFRWHAHHWPDGHPICPRLCHACWRKGRR